MAYCGSAESLCNLANMNYENETFELTFLLLFSSYLWVAMSSMYGKLLVLLMLAFCLTEVMDNEIRPLAFQGLYMMYLYVGSIVAIMCIYITVLIDNCPSVTGARSREPLTGGDDAEAGSVASFGTLRRAHIDRTKVSRTSFYLRVGALGKFILKKAAEGK